LTLDAFIQIMTPLQEKYPKHFVPETMKPIYQIIGHLTIDQGRHIVGTLILRHRFAPLESDFKDAVTELFRPKSFVKHKEERFDPIFSDEERAEIWQFVKDVAVGKHDESTIKSYTEALNSTIKRYYSK
jgi:hypothetical protein